MKQSESNLGKENLFGKSVGAVVSINWINTFKIMSKILNKFFMKPVILQFAYLT